MTWDKWLLTACSQKEICEFWVKVTVFNNPSLKSHPFSLSGFQVRSTWSRLKASVSGGSLLRCIWAEITSGAPKVWWSGFQSGLDLFTQIQSCTLLLWQRQSMYRKITGTKVNVTAMWKGFTVLSMHATTPESKPWTVVVSVLSYRRRTLVIV